MKKWTQISCIYRCLFKVKKWFPILGGIGEGQRKCEYQQSAGQVENSWGHIFRIEKIRVWQILMFSPVIFIEWIFYTGLLTVLAWRGEISLAWRQNLYTYIAVGLGIKKISFPFSVHHSSYNTRLLSTKGESAISLMQWRTCTNVLRRAI
jgi:hypothetical protein